MNRYLKQLALVALALTAIPVFRFVSASSPPGRIASVHAHQLVEKGARLVDVRTPAEYAERHLPNAINVPLQELSSKLAVLEPKDQTIILYCRSGNRSGLAYEQLRREGFSNLYDLGPLSAW